MDFKILKEIRTYHDVKQKEIAEQLKVTRATYSNWENNHDIIPLTKLNDFCNYFQVSLDYVCNLTNQNNKKLSFIKIDNALVGNNLKTIRKDHNHTQEYIAKKISISRSQYTDYELGKCLINIVNIIEFAKFYHISLDWLCGKCQEKDII